MKHTIPIATGLFMLLTTSCHDKMPWKANLSLPPNIFYVQITKNDVSIPDSIILATKLYYYNNEGQLKDRLSPSSDDTTFISLPSRFTTGLDNAGIIASGYLSGMVSDGYHNVYLKFPDGDIDTLYLEVGNLKYDDATENSCYCIGPFTKVEVNGKDLPESTELHSGDGKPVFVF